MNKPDGGPAFARPGSPQGKFSDSRVPRDQEGMSLRDYFAAKALQGMLSFPGNEQWGDFVRMGFGLAAETAYNYADAMIAQRNK